MNNHNGNGCPMRLIEDGYDICFQTGRTCPFKDRTECETYRNYEVHLLFNNKRISDQSEERAK
jgi:hypothetical protein